MATAKQLGEAVEQGGRRLLRIGMSNIGFQVWVIVFGLWW